MLWCSWVSVLIFKLHYDTIENKVKVSDDRDKKNSFKGADTELIAKTYSTSLTTNNYQLVSKSD